MLADEGEHAAFVDAWLDRAGRGLPPERLVSLFERAVVALWRRAFATLGEVTLSAVVDRVLYRAATLHPLASRLSVERTGVRFDELLARGALADAGELRELVRFVVVEVLVVLGNLTGEILTPALHAELARVGTDDLEHTEGDA